MTQRHIQQIVPALPASDGAGVKLMRSLGGHRHIRVDPFLMLDEFSSENPDDYIAGFPPHPHRGFETITYMLAGNMRHEDHLGNRGHLKAGGAQWMTAGRGIIHSEMPEQVSGKMHGFQLWLNLPAAEKMKPASYRDIPAREIPHATFAGGNIKVIAGSQTISGKRLNGPINGSINGINESTNGSTKALTTDPYFFDVQLDANQTFTLHLPEAHQAFVYPYEGDLYVDTASTNDKLSQQQAGILSTGAELRVQSKNKPVSFILLAGNALNEPIAQYGPFVMNTREEVEQAMQDYREGKLV